MISRLWKHSSQYRAPRPQTAKVPKASVLPEGDDVYNLRVRYHNTFYLLVFCLKDMTGVVRIEGDYMTKPLLVGKCNSSAPEWYCISGFPVFPFRVGVNTIDSTLRIRSEHTSAFEGMIEPGVPVAVHLLNDGMA